MQPLQTERDLRHKSWAELIRGHCPLVSTRRSVIATVSSSVLCDYSILEIYCSMKSLQDRVGCHSLQCQGCTVCCSAADQREICHQHKRHFLGAGTKVRTECVCKKCQMRMSEWIDLVSFFFYTGDNLMPVHFVICGYLLLCRKKASSQHFSGLQRCGTCHEF